MADVDLRGKRVFIRADLNVPQDDSGAITDDTRIRASVPGIRMALDKGAAVMVTSHLGRPKEGELKPEDSLLPISKRLSELMGIDVPLVKDWIDGVDVKPGQVVLLENCRVNKGEKADDEKLARKIAALCDVYVNDAFGTAHRAMPPPTTSWSTFFASAASTVSLVETLAPATMATSGRFGLASALPSASSSAAISGPAQATLANLAAPCVVASARCAVPKASFT